MEEEAPLAPQEQQGLKGPAAELDRRARKKLWILAEQVLKHCKSKQLQCFIFHEGLRPGELVQSAMTSPALIVSLLRHLATGFPELLKVAVEEMNAELPVLPTSPQPNEEVKEA